MSNTYTKRCHELEEFRARTEKKRESFALEYNTRKSQMNKASTSDIKELQAKIMSDIVSFLKQRNIGDIEEISFMTDNIQDSVKFGEWHPATDSSISCDGIEYTKETGYLARHYHIGDYC